MAPGEPAAPSPMTSAPAKSRTGSTGTEPSRWQRNGYCPMRSTWDASSLSDPIIGELLQACANPVLAGYPPIGSMEPVLVMVCISSLAISTNPFVASTWAPPLRHRFNSSLASSLHREESRHRKGNGLLLGPGTLPIHHPAHPRPSLEPASGSIWDHGDPECFERRVQGSSNRQLLVSNWKRSSIAPSYLGTCQLLP